MINKKRFVKDHKSKKEATLPTWFGGAVDKLKSTKVYRYVADLITSIKDLPFFKRKHYFSLYVGLVGATVLGILASAFFYFISQVTVTYIIDNEYATEEKKSEREQLYIDELQIYIDENALSSKDMDQLLSREGASRYVNLFVYNDTLVNGSDTASRDELIAYARENGLYTLDMSDGMILAAVNDFSHYSYYNISATVNMFVAMVVLAFIIINHFRNIISRIKRLESDVAVVSYSDMNHAITSQGYDDIAKLSANVETMRITILDNLRKEQDARNANTDLITSLSHDIRTPLTVILGYLEMMKERATDEELRNYMAVTESTALRLKQLSDDMFKYFLAYGNTEEQITQEEYDAHTLITQMLSEHLLLLSESGYEIDLHEDINMEPGTRVLTDADNLMRIIDNIFSNLYKYADSSCPIRVEIKQIGDAVVFEFKNKILENTGAESNRIGLKTCARLAEFVTESFEYHANAGVFTTRMVLKIILPQNTEQKEI